MRALAALLAVALLAIGVSACGGGGKGSTASSDAAATVATTKTTPWPKPTHLPSLATTRRFVKDPHLSIGALREDSRIFAFMGRAPTASVSRAVARVVRRYYAVAATGNAKRACAMLTPSMMVAVPADYSQFGPRYLHDAKTCTAVLSRMFRHYRRELAAPVTVDGVLAKGHEAHAVLHSKTLPPTTITLIDEHHVWMLEAPLGGVIPVIK